MASTMAKKTASQVNGKSTKLGDIKKRGKRYRGTTNLPWSCGQLVAITLDFSLR